MSRLRNGSTLTGAILMTSVVLFSAAANAQNVETAPAQTPAAESAAASAPVKAADETTAAFLARVHGTNPDMVTLSAAELFKQSPTQGTVGDLITIASSTDAAAADLTAKVTNGFPVIAVSTSAAQFSEQLSALVLSDSSQLPAIVALAQRSRTRTSPKLSAKVWRLPIPRRCRGAIRYWQPPFSCRPRARAYLPTFLSPSAKTSRNGGWSCGTCGCGRRCIADRRRRVHTGQRKQHRRLGDRRPDRWRYGTSRWFWRPGWPWQIAFNRQHQHRDKHKPRLNLMSSPFHTGTAITCLTMQPRLGGLFARRKERG